MTTATEKLIDNLYSNKKNEKTWYLSEFHNQARLFVAESREYEINDKMQFLIEKILYVSFHSKNFAAS